MARPLVRAHQLNVRLSREEAKLLQLLADQLNTTRTEAVVRGIQALAASTGFGQAPTAGSVDGNTRLKD